MHFGVSIPPFGKFGDVRHLGQLAKSAEQAGWDGFFIWDHIFFDPTFHPMADVSVALAVIAMHTSHIKIGAMVTPLARRRPWKLARETVSIDLLSNGRLIVGAGLGDPVQWDFGFFHEEASARVRAEKLDESLDILTGLWQGEMFNYQGKHYQIEPVRFQPVPIQQPRIPIWIGGGWDKIKPQERAARYDGYIPLKFGDELTLAEWEAIKQTILEQRGSLDGFNLVHSGQTAGENSDTDILRVKACAEIGISWWMESVDPWRWGDSWEEPMTDEATRQMEIRIQQGPPKIG